MSQPVDPVPAYFQRRALLQAQAAGTRARATTRQIDLALFASHAAAASVYDLQQVLGANAAGLQAEVDLRARQSSIAVAQVETAIASARQAATVAAAHTDMLAAALAAVQARAALPLAEMAVLRHELLQLTGLMWLELLDILFRADDRRQFVAVLDKVLVHAAGLLPVIGNVLSALLAAAELAALRRKPAQDADAYLLSLESYVDAANLYLKGAMGYCEAMDRLLAGLPPPTDADIVQRVRTHLDSVRQGTHPASG